MKTTLTPFTISELATPSGNKIPVRGKTIDVTHLDVETFNAGNIVRLVFWTANGEAEAIILTGQVTHMTDTVDATKREDV